MVLDPATPENALNSKSTFNRGSNQSGMRAYNERLVLSLLRQQAGFAKSDITRITGLSAQTISVIMRALEDDGLIVRGEPVRVRGKVGQPSVPMSLNPAGALFFGLKIGRRSFNLILIDFLGNTVDSVHRGYDFPVPSDAVRFAQEAMTAMLAKLTPAQQKSVAGLGVSTPFEMWNWVEKIGAPLEVMDAWRAVDLRAEISAGCDFPVYLQNDATAACGAEMVFGTHQGLRDFIYFYIGYFIGGGLVLNGSLFVGRRGNAAALGSIPVIGGDGETRQLIDIASIATLQNKILQAGGNADSFLEDPVAWDMENPLVQEWIDNAGKGIAQAMISAMAVIEYDAALVDGWIPHDVRTAIIQSVDKYLLGMAHPGIDKPVAKEGTVGPYARELGAACIPLSERFLVDHNAFLKEE